MTIFSNPGLSVPHPSNRTVGIFPVARRSRRSLLAIGVLAALLTAACSDGPIVPQTGSLRVSILTTGGDPDIDGYSLAIGSQPQRPVGSAATVVIDDLSAGTHLVALEGVAANCSVEGPQSRTITVPSGGIAEVQFTVSCDATGIRVTTRTTGADLPYGGYSLVTGPWLGSVEINGSVTVSRLSPGSHTVSVTVRENCSVAGGNVATVNVLNRVVTPVTFEIICVRTDKRIAFVRDTILAGNKLTSAVLVASETGSNIVHLAVGHSPAWSPDGSRLIYSTAECDFYYYECGGGLEIVDPYTRTVTVPAGGGLGLDPVWSPDGTTVAFFRAGGNGARELELLRLDGSPTVWIAATVGSGRPSWSPDGQRIAFHCLGNLGTAASDYDICVIRRDGTALMRLTTGPAHDSSPAWSPDGSLIAFATLRYTGQSEVALMASDGTGIRRLTTGSDPAWLPDGTRLVLARRDGLFTIAPDGSGLTRITTGNHRAPAWRP